MEAEEKGKKSMQRLPKITMKNFSTIHLPSFLPSKSFPKDISHQNTI